MLILLASSFKNDALGTLILKEAWFLFETERMDQCFRCCGGFLFLTESIETFGFLNSHLDFSFGFLISVRVLRIAVFSLSLLNLINIDLFEEFSPQWVWAKKVKILLVLLLPRRDSAEVSNEQAFELKHPSKNLYVCFVKMFLCTTHCSVVRDLRSLNMTLKAAKFVLENKNSSQIVLSSWSLKMNAKSGTYTL